MIESSESVLSRFVRSLSGFRGHQVIVLYSTVLKNIASSRIRVILVFWPFFLTTKLYASVKTSILFDSIFGRF